MGRLVANYMRLEYEGVLEFLKSMEFLNFWNSLLILFFFFFNPLFGCSYNLSIWSLEEKKVRIFRITCLLKLGIKAGLEFEGCLRFCSCWETLEILGTLFFFFMAKNKQLWLVGDALHLHVHDSQFVGVHSHNVYDLVVRRTIYVLLSYLIWGGLAC